MPRRTDLRHVLVIGSGPIVIGQACEFDYSGTQACRVLRAEGLQVSLVNSNPATIMTDPEYADHTYVEPITPTFVEKVIAQQAERGNKIDALLATLGGQTALNTAVALYENGALERYGIELIGADFDAIQRGEDRQMFKDIVAKVGGESARSRVCFTMDEVRETVGELGLPVVVRPSFTMGGLGSGLAHTAEEVDRMAGAGLAAAFNAPLAGVMFVLEELQGNFTPVVFVAAFLASVVADIVGRVLTGEMPVFALRSMAVPTLSALPLALVLGALAGLTSVMLVMLLGQTRVLYAMANDGLLPKKFFAAVHPKFRTPWKNRSCCSAACTCLSANMSRRAGSSRRCSTRTPHPRYATRPGSTWERSGIKGAISRNPSAR